VATDITDKQLGACRKVRCAKAFEVNQDNDATADDVYQKDACDSSFGCRPHDAALAHLHQME
jgi:hypothetical protein